MTPEKLENAVTRVSRGIDTLVKQMERAGATAEQARKAFLYLNSVVTVAHSRALLNASGPGATFSLDAELPATAAPIALPSPVAAPALLPAPGATTRSGLTVDQVGGRLVKEARGETPGGTVPASDDGVGFLDDDEDEDDTSPPSSTAIGGVDFLED